MLQKQALDISFAQGLDTKTDPFRVQPGKFLSLVNSIFDKQGQLTKRNGFTPLPVLPDTSSKFLTTFNGNLTAIGNNLEALYSGAKQWGNKGSLLPISLSTLSLVRSNTSQVQADSAVSTNGLVCTAYVNVLPQSGSTYEYVISDSITGQNIIAPVIIYSFFPVDSLGLGCPRVFILGSYFIILFNSFNGTTSDLLYIAISTSNPTQVTAPITVATTYAPSIHAAYDGIVLNNRLYMAYNTLSGGQSIKLTYITNTLGSPITPVAYASQEGSIFSLTTDMTAPSNPLIYVSYYNDSDFTTKSLVIDQNLNPVLAPTLLYTTDSDSPFVNLASIAQNGIMTLFVHCEIEDTVRLIQSITLTQAGVVGSNRIILNQIGLASKAFLFQGKSYFLAFFKSDFQPSLFLISTAGEPYDGQVMAKLAYSNAGLTYLTLPSAVIQNNVVNAAYLIKSSLQASSKAQGSSSAGILSQTGVNLVTFNLDISSITTSEIGANLNISGGFITAYDGLQPVEQGFFVWPEPITGHTTSGSGDIEAGTYFYQVTYEWTDNQGNLFRSAPSIPFEIVTTGSNSTNTLTIPNLSLTYKTLSPPRLVVYRWSQAQQVYYQVTAIDNPLLNSPSVQTQDFIDTLSDADILGNNILYTTGGVLEDISPPSSNLMTLFNNRLFLVDAEDPNLLWFSKQVIEATPVEMSDLLTIYVAPTTASEGSTGPMTAIAPMDDKLIIYKNNALGYINGIGPDNTGANSNYSDFTLINSVVGCTNQNSIVFTPAGLMFQSNKGIWLLGRNLSTQYIGAPVEEFTQGALVKSALNVPSTNQVRFTMDSGITIMYDYYYDQWGTFENIPAISSTIYQNMHTYINSRGQVFQESPGAYLDNTSPVLMSFTTSWMNLAGVQGYERFYSMYMLGNYITPFKLNVQLAYDYNDSATQATLVTPITPAKAWGGDELWGSSTPFGGPSRVFEARVFPTIQKCESFQITIDEIYDSSLGISAGEGLTLSGLNLVVGMKKGYRVSSAGRSFG